MNVRTYLIFAVCGWILAVATGLAWISRQPDHPWLVRAESWSWIGPMVFVLREAYHPPVEITAGGPPTAEKGIGGAAPEWRVPPRLDTRESPRVLPGRATPAPSRETEPPRPLWPVGPDASLLAEALALMDGDEVVQTHFGPYAAFSDVHDDEWFAVLSTVAAQVEPLWIERHGLLPLGQPASVVVLYRSEASYRALERASDQLRGLDAEGFAGFGLVVTYVGDKRREHVAATLIHELCHRIHRRALGPALPPWLDEGMADDLALSRLVGDRLDTGGYSGQRETLPGKGTLQVRFDQGLAALWTVREEILRGHLPRLGELADLDRDQFLDTRQGRSTRRLRYDAMALWVRYLVSADRGRHREGWQTFLRRVAEGGPVSVDALLAALGSSADPLEADYRTWVVRQSRDFVGE